MLALLLLAVSRNNLNLLGRLLKFLVLTLSSSYRILVQLAIPAGEGAPMNVLDSTCSYKPYAAYDDVIECHCQSYNAGIT